MKAAAIFIVVASLSLPGTRVMAGGGPTTPSAPSPGVEDARQHFQRGVQLFREGSFDAALADFRRAYEIQPNYRILYNVAQVQVERHDYAAALKLFRTYLELGGAEIAPERRESVETEESDLANRVAQMSIDVDVNDAEVSVDGVVVGSTPLAGPVLVNAGIRSILVRKPGYVDISRPMTIAGGEISRLQVHIALEPGAASSAETSRNSSVKRAPLWWIGLGTTAALAAAWTTFGLLAEKTDADLEARLGAFPADRSRIADDRTREKTFSAIADGFAAGAILSLGLTVYAILSTGTSPRDPAASESRNAALKVVPTKAGVELTGRF